MLLDQCHHALVELMEVGPAEEYTGQGDEAERGNQPGAVALVTQAGIQAQADQHREGAGDDPGVQPEAFRQGQAHGGAGGPAG
ncbi:hypothetical protein D9M73_178420 [compost metagenome]